MTADGSRLIVGGLGRITLLEPKWGIELLSFTANDDLVSAIDLAPSGDGIVAAGIDNQMTLWRNQVSDTTPFTEPVTEPVTEPSF